ncbi:MAG: TIGR04255 family protein [Vampirovibrionales bacterium]|nr:TIGR04255 family protein [Vampirovibrionales bacterium]
MGQNLKNAPLYFTIAQVRFNRLMVLDSCIDKIQEAFRLLNYPDYQETQQAILSLSIAPTDKDTQIPVRRILQYSFLNFDRTAGFTLDQNSLSFETTTYQTFESFSKDFFAGLDALLKIVKPDYIERIGLRYLDAIVTEPADKVSEFLTSSVSGLLSQARSGLMHSFSETSYDTNSVNVLARVIFKNGKIGMPPDITTTNLQLLEKFQKIDGLHATLDIDCSMSKRELLNIDTIIKYLDIIHDESSKAFHSLATADALASWS